MQNISYNYYNAYYTYIITNTYYPYNTNSTYDHYTTYQTNGINLHHTKQCKVERRNNIQNKNCKYLQSL